MWTRRSLFPERERTLSFGTIAQLWMKELFVEHSPSPFVVGVSGGAGRRCWKEGGTPLKCNGEFGLWEDQSSPPHTLLILRVLRPQS